MKFQGILLSTIAMFTVAFHQPASTAWASATHPMQTKTATPVFSPAPGTYGWDQSVKISDSTAGSTIYYTTNGTTPTTASAKYKSPIMVSKTQTIRAIAVGPGHAESALAKGTYTLVDALEVITATGSGNGLVTVPVGRESAFAVFIKNNGKQADPAITVSTSATPATLPVEIDLCETNSNTGQCLAPPAKSVKLSSLPSGANRSFSVFVTAKSSIADDPSANRISVLFKNSHGSIEASGSVAVTTK